MNLGANILILISLHAGLLHGSNLETCEPRSYNTKIIFASFRATTLYKPEPWGDVNLAARGSYRSELRYDINLFVPKFNSVYLQHQTQEKNSFTFKSNSHIVNNRKQ